METKNTAYTGIARGRLIELEDGATLPDGMRVSIIPEEPVFVDAVRSLKEWLREARQVRAQLPVTGDSVEIMRQLREGRGVR